MFKGVCQVRYYFSTVCLHSLRQKCRLEQSLTLASPLPEHQRWANPTPPLARLQRLSRISPAPTRVHTVCFASTSAYIPPPDEATATPK